MKRSQSVTTPLGLTISILLIVLSLESVLSYKIQPASVSQLFKDYETWKLKLFPDLAYKDGYTQYDAFLPNSSLSALEYTKTGCEYFKNQVTAELAGQSLTKEDRHALRVMLYETETCLKGLPLKGFLLPPIHQRHGIQIRLPAQFKRRNLQSAPREEVDALFKKMLAIPDYLKGVQDRLAQGVAQGITFAPASMAGVEDQFDDLQVASPEESDFYAPFASLSESRTLDPSLVSQIQDAVKAQVKEKVLPAFKSLRDFIANEYRRNLRSSPGVSAFPNGKAYYQAALDFHATLPNVEADVLYDEGFRVVEGLRAELKKILDKYVGSKELPLDEQIMLVLRDDNMYFNSENSLLQALQNLIDEKISVNLDQVLSSQQLTSDVFDLQVYKVDHGRAQYLPGSEKWSAGILINTDKYRNFRRTELLPLALNLGNPGQHLATVSNQDFPKSMNGELRDDPSMVPSTFPSYTAHARGWDTYAEYLGFDMGLYNDEPIGPFEYYLSNLFLAARLVADVGIHAKGWTRNEAIDYLAQNTFILRDRAVMEVDRIITFPGIETAVKIGETFIRNMRRAREEKETSGFDLKKFHEDLLACKGPLTLLQTCMDDRN
ncbi:hypothetical protein TCAL_05772 [Tigriopus californicus]|uniref:DUF885 domain-containing protein n=1 Tax=Tigriopus californicus TaxID=6832 RepID=A0A553NCS7_TIGCA|nr:uncharacterized protein LOC131887790 isoform X1 [Tigriopus californicus]XP_059092474.1 uncharacterized protein LOC131887790 isoform X1 [Tigriopus californicus]XP_059092475.1 uncharacterized protein LOC131887790 isoform X1 [Tigriopus californicus]XP_059092476.1 uncharacterized protein LOC131887790 isoform X1 [Tigriopus californicus]TRY63250.1 hypothetical protein TCAL_05772 [Tigriopus californicus]|eukprot:TCALIF_05772-PA protein Name:"Protein of unknown function" AED:0.26 eAED:0.32 QI:0/-1/0/1/-1/1/1/0/604